MDRLKEPRRKRDVVGANVVVGETIRVDEALEDPACAQNKKGQKRTDRTNERTNERTYSLDGVHSGSLFKEVMDVKRNWWNE